MATELELKYSIAEARFPLPAELEAAARQRGWTLHELGVVAHHDRYFDDANRRIRAAGLALRQRRVGESKLAAVKWLGRAEDALHVREELEVPMPGDAWPHEILERLSPVAAATALDAVLEIKATRQRFWANDESGATAEISCDQVVASAPHLETSAHFLEVEIEAVRDISSGRLKVLAKALAAIMTLTPCSVNKLERAEALLELASAWSQA